MYVHVFLIIYVYIIDNKGEKRKNTAKFEKIISRHKITKQL